MKEENFKKQASTLQVDGLYYLGKLVAFGPVFLDFIFLSLMKKKKYLKFVCGSNTKGNCAHGL